MQIVDQWFERQGWKPHLFQKETWEAMHNGYSGMLNAPTGYGKTYALWMGVLMDYLCQTQAPNGLHCLWINPLRALSKEIELATQRASKEIAPNYRVGSRTGDTTAQQRKKQRSHAPHALITTPESLHLMLAQKGYADYFGNLRFVIIDEWHELLGSKRGVQIELALSRLKVLNPSLMIWGISATIGNIDQAMHILLGKEAPEGRLIRSDIHKKINIHTLLPDSIERFPWAGHIGTSLLPKIIPILQQSRSTLIFTNTRAMAEIWYQQLIHELPEWAGLVALHHGSLSEEIRQWVETALHEGKLKAVVCTSSLDLGVDFQPVDSVIQIGSPKGVARFMQRAGRSGHSPGAESNIWFLPTHSLEIIEGCAIREAVDIEQLEERIPYIRSFDVLIQYLITLAVSDGFEPETLYEEITSTHAYESVSREEWQWLLHFIVKGGESLHAYDEFQKVIVENGIYRVTDKRIALRHRLSMGTIVSSTMMQVKYLGGKRLGSIEEWFIARLDRGDVFWFAGRNLEIVMVQGMDVLVKRTQRKSGPIPSYQGGRMPLSSSVSLMVRHKIDELKNGQYSDSELKSLIPLFSTQQEISHVPSRSELLIEQLESQEGHHIFVYPFEGRFVHEGMAALMAHRMGKIQRISFSIAMNDYGFELLSDQKVELNAELLSDLFSAEHLADHALQSMNATEMARRRFRDIAGISGLVFQGYPGKNIKTRHLQASSQLFFDVFREYEPDHLLLKQAKEEVLEFQLEIRRMQQALERIAGQRWIVKVLKQPSPFCFPLIVDGIREKYSNEELEDRIRKMKIAIQY